jgi:hypothetical protein
LIKTATGLPVTVVIVKIGITGDLGCGSGYEQITAIATATAYTLLYNTSIPLVPFNVIQLPLWAALRTLYVNIG